MSNDIISFLDIDDDDLILLDSRVEDNKKILHVQKKLKPTYCELCGYRMHSKGITTRKVNHPVLQNGYSLLIELDQRSWYCSNPSCRNHFNDSFIFVDRMKHNSNLTPLMILNEMRDLELTARAVAERFDVSDTYVHDTFLKYVNCERLPLPRILCVDEVHLHFSERNRYALVLMDFETGTIIDILPNRLKDTYQNYFHSIPKEERDNVEILICDMYNPYINFSVNYLHNASVVVDSFHVIQWINNKINLYMNKVKKKYQERDREELERKNEESNQENETMKQSQEVYLLNKYRWILLSNPKNVERSYRKKYNRFLGQYLDYYDYEKKFLDLDENFLLIKNLRDRYYKFNETDCHDMSEKEEELDYLIRTYEECELEMFHEFAALLKKYKCEILNSFKCISEDKDEAYGNIINKTEVSLRRLSNGPMESFNRKPKDFKRNARGFSNYEYVIKRIIWANRKDEHVRAVPKETKDIRRFKGKKRGPYKKKVRQ